MKLKLGGFVSLSGSNFVAGGILGLFWIFLADYLSKSDYGELGYLMGIVNVAFVISLMGLGTTVSVFEPKKENIFPAAFVLIIISSGIATIITLIITQNISASILILGMSIYNIILTGLTSKKRYKDYAKWIIIRSVVAVTLSLVFFQILGINGILIGYFISSLLILKDLKSLIQKRKVEFSKIRPKMKFMIHMWANRTSDVIFYWGDKILIGAIFGFTMLAEYQFAAQYMILLSMIPRSVRQYLLPQESEGVQKKKLKKYAIIGVIMIAVLSVILVPFGIENLLPKYNDSILAIQIMSISIIPLTITTIQSVEFLAKANSRIVLVGSFLQSGLYIILILVLGNYYGLEGFAIGFLVSLVIRVIYNNMYKALITTKF